MNKAFEVTVYKLGGGRQYSYETVARDEYEAESNFEKSKRDSDLYCEVEEITE